MLVNHIMPTPQFSIGRYGNTDEAISPAHPFHFRHSFLIILHMLHHIKSTNQIKTGINKWQAGDRTFYNILS